jgi:hypothetical protein
MSQLEYPKRALVQHIGVSAMGEKCDILAKDNIMFLLDYYGDYATKC